MKKLPTFSHSHFILCYKEHFRDHDCGRNLVWVVLMVVFISGGAWAGLSCSSDPCFHGVCIDHINSSYWCYCEDGFTGYQCQTNWDECWSQPCQNNATCVDLIAAFECLCQPGYTGALCESEINECLSNPCLNNGTCKDRLGHYECHCAVGFKGVNCEIDISVCNITDPTESKCQNGGVCVDGPGLSFTCLCTPGWEGRTCEKDRNECFELPCYNGAQCVNTPGSFLCACQYGFTGRLCEDEVIQCVVNLCQNNALCVMEDGNATCYCVPDFHGSVCEDRYNDCLPNAPRCMNGGTCIDGVDSFNCSCPNNAFGVLCECVETDSGELCAPLPDWFEEKVFFPIIDVGVLHPGYSLSYPAPTSTREFIVYETEIYDASRFISKYYFQSDIESETPSAKLDFSTLTDLPSIEVTSATVEAPLPPYSTPAILETIYITDILPLTQSVSLKVEPTPTSDILYLMTIDVTPTIEASLPDFIDASPTIQVTYSTPLPDLETSLSLDTPEIYSSIDIYESIYLFTRTYPVSLISDISISSVYYPEVFVSPPTDETTPPTPRSDTTTSVGEPKNVTDFIDFSNATYLFEANVTAIKDNVTEPIVSFEISEDSTLSTEQITFRPDISTEFADNKSIMTSERDSLYTTTSSDFYTGTTTHDQFNISLEFTTKEYIEMNFTSDLTKEVSLYETTEITSIFPFDISTTPSTLDVFTPSNGTILDEVTTKDFTSAVYDETTVITESVSDSTIDNDTGIIRTTAALNITFSEGLETDKVTTPPTITDVFLTTEVVPSERVDEFNTTDDSLSTKVTDEATFSPATELTSHISTSKEVDKFSTPITDNYTELMKPTGEVEFQTTEYSVPPKEIETTMPSTKESIITTSSKDDFLTVITTDGVFETTSDKATTPISKTTVVETVIERVTTPMTMTEDVTESTSDDMPTSITEADKITEFAVEDTSIFSATTEVGIDRSSTVPTSEFTSLSTPEDHTISIDDVYTTKIDNFTTSVDVTTPFTDISSVITPLKDSSTQEFPATATTTTDDMTRLFTDVFSESSTTEDAAIITSTSESDSTTQPLDTTKDDFTVLPSTEKLSSVIPTEEVKTVFDEFTSPSTSESFKTTSPTIDDLSTPISTTEKIFNISFTEPFVAISEPTSAIVTSVAKDDSITTQGITEPFSDISTPPTQEFVSPSIETSELPFGLTMESTTEDQPTLPQVITDAVGTPTVTDTSTVSISTEFGTTIGTGTTYEITEEYEITPLVCSSLDCFNGGICISFGPGKEKCRCPFNYIGNHCETYRYIKHPYFRGSSYLKLAVGKLLLRDGVKFYIQFTSESPNGLLAYAEGNADSFFMLLLRNSVLQFIFSCGLQTVSFLQGNRKLTEGSKTDVIVRMFWKASVTPWEKGKCIAFMQVNNTAPLYSEQAASAKVQLGALFLGGLPSAYSSPLVVKAGFLPRLRGCVSLIEINEGEIDIWLTAVEGEDVKECGTTLCPVSACFNGGTCIPAVAQWSCECPQGFEGQLCERRTCIPNPCYSGICLPSSPPKEFGASCLCPAELTGPLCKQPLPTEDETRFSYTGSYRSYSSYTRHKISFDHRKNLVIRFHFTTQQPNQVGLLFYLGCQINSANRDFFSLSLVRSYLMLTWDLGAGPKRIFSYAPIDPTWHTHSVRIGKTLREGWLEVDTQPKVSANAPGFLSSLETNGVVYLGGHSSWNMSHLPVDLSNLEGFQGCIFDVRAAEEVQGPWVTLPLLTSSGVGQCGRDNCDGHLCGNGALCRPFGGTYQCICGPGWKGYQCNDEGHICQEGQLPSCSPGSSCLKGQGETGAPLCLCPYGKVGPLCETELNITDPMFTGEDSFLSLEGGNVLRRFTSVSLDFKPSSADGILFLAAPTSPQGDFLSLTIQNGTLNLVYKLGSNSKNAVEIKSSRPVVLDQWQSVSLTRNGTQGTLTFRGVTDTNPQRFSRIGSFKEADFRVMALAELLDVQNNVFLGGIPDKSIRPSDQFNLMNVPRFKGCMRKVSLGDSHFDLNEKEKLSGKLRGQGVSDCDGTACGSGVCTNGGTCSPDVISKSFNCDCQKGYTGRRCEIHQLCFNHKCRAGGTCEPRKHSKHRRSSTIFRWKRTSNDFYICLCPPGRTGEYCEEAAKSSSAQFRGRSYAVVTEGRFLAFTDPTKDSLSLNFSSSSDSGVIFWKGHTEKPGKDYIGLGIDAGRLKFIWHLGGDIIGEIYPRVPVNDGSWHSVSIVRYAQEVTIYLDGTPYAGGVEGEFKQLNAPNVFYLGGFSDSLSLRFTTDLHFFKSFVGCLKDVLLHPSSSNVIFSEVKEGRDLQPCPKLPDSHTAS